jgi:hypothetical protein
MNATTSSYEPKRPRVLKTKEQRWESMKADIHRTYLKEMKTLPEVMKEIECLYEFTAREDSQFDLQLTRLIGLQRAKVENETKRMGLCQKFDREYQEFCHK